ncbi:NUDIX domain-containing protein, partial [Escherichia coli]|uniref:NUDIX domain-containing protein n=1 Tax=Escherichia coli TaxID=562 RepID=UPI001F1E4E52
MKIVKVAAAILFFGNKILLTKRQQGKDYAGMWEFPGGKLENYETFKQALQRELFEELGLKVLEQNLEPYYYDEFVDG